MNKDDLNHLACCCHPLPPPPAMPFCCYLTDNQRRHIPLVGLFTFDSQNHHNVSLVLISPSILICQKMRPYVGVFSLVFKSPVLSSKIFFCFLFSLFFRFPSLPVRLSSFSINVPASQQPTSS